MKSYAMKSNFTRTTLSMAENDTFILEKKTLLGFSIDTMPLFAFSPEYKVIKKGMSRLGIIFLYVEFVALIGFLVALCRDHSWISVSELKATLVIVSIFISISIFYWFITRRSLLCLFYQNGKVAYTLSYKKNELAQQEWLQQFKLAIRNARLNQDKNNFIKIGKGIAYLQKQALINPQFAEELQHRLNDLSTSIVC